MASYEFIFGFIMATIIGKIFGQKSVERFIEINLIMMCFIYTCILAFISSTIILEKFTVNQTKERILY